MSPPILACDVLSKQRFPIINETFNPFHDVCVVLYSLWQ
jgi:hypothetical protein